MSVSNGARLGVVDDAGRGTPAGDWVGWSDAVPDLDIDHWTDVVVVAPHPDDEVLGAGGLMARLAALGRTVRVLAVTDGAGARPPAGWSTEQLACERVEEAVAACAALGVDPPRRLGFPDGAVGEHEDALAASLGQVLNRDTLCVATWREDGHPDHEATGRAAALACAHTGATLVEYPVWMWHWARPLDPAVPWERARRYRLSPGERVAKHAAVQCHRSQLEPPAAGVDAVLPPFVVDRLVTDQEMLLL